MKRSLCLIAITMLCLYGTGCRETAESWNDKAMMAFMAGNQEEAIRCFKQTLALDPTDLKAHFYLGWIYEVQGKLDEGIAEYKKALEINPNHGGTYNRLGGMYLAKGMLDNAVETFKKVAALNPDSETAYYGLGMAYHKQSKCAEAADALFEAGLLAALRNNKGVAFNAYNGIKETGYQQLAEELHEVLGPWFNPANEVTTQPQGSRSKQ